MTHALTITAQTNVQLQLFYMGQVSSPLERGCEAGRFHSSEDCVCHALMWKSIPFWMPTIHCHSYLCWLARFCFSLLFNINGCRIGHLSLVLWFNASVLQFDTFVGQFRHLVIVKGHPRILVSNYWIHSWTTTDNSLHTEDVAICHWNAHIQILIGEILEACYLKDCRGTMFLQFRVCSLKATYQMFHHSFRMNQFLVCALKSRKILR